MREHDLAYPFMVHGVDGNVCGGTLIWPDIVLSAAHCSKAFVKQVIVGSNRLAGSDMGTTPTTTATTTERIMIDFLYPHPHYFPGLLRNDIMLIKLKNSSEAPYVTLNDDPNLPLDGQPVTVLGFGRTVEGGGSMSPDLRHIELPIVPLELCRTRYPGFVFASHLCAGLIHGGVDACDGDSGGPMIDSNKTNIVQYGIVSFGFGCARPNSPGMYTRVSYYMD